MRICFSNLARVFAIVTGIAPPAALAQETIHYASIAGRVTDPSGAVIAGARITARQTDTNLSRTAASDQEGRFHFPYLRAGHYEIIVHDEGFADSIRLLTVNSGGAYDLPITLFVEVPQISVTVNADAMVLETARSQVSSSIRNSEVESTPLSGRNFMDLALLAPGVSPTNTASTQLFPETSAVPGQGISVSSQRNFSNNFVVDGLSANDDSAGLAGSVYGVDSIQEMQVVTSGAQAEFGRALGGYVSIVTKSGTNQLHGDLYGYFKNQRLNARNALSSTLLPSTQAQFGASLGGPLVRDRMFYFANFEQRDLNQSGLITISPANVDAINARLVAAGFRGPLVTTGQYPNPVHSNIGLLKADHQIASNDQFSVRYSAYQVTSANSRGAGALNSISAAAGLDDIDQALTAGNVFTISPRLVLETRAEYSRSNLSAQPNDSIGPAVTISGVATFGRLSTSPTARLNKTAELVNNLSYQAGPHAIRLGVDFLYDATTIAFPRASRGSYSFSSLGNFLAGIYNNQGFTQTFGNTMVSLSNPNAGFYAQDQWNVSPFLTLNAGLRYDAQFLDTISTDTNNISPRLGFAWSLTNSQKTIIRGTFGLFYDRVPLRALANALLSSGNTTSIGSNSQLTISLSPSQTGAPMFPDVMGFPPPNVLVNFTTMNRHLQNAYSEVGSFEIERQIGSRAAVSVGYEHLRGLHLIVSVNQNVPSCTASGGNNGCRPNPNYANNAQYSSLGDSHYDGLQVSFVQRPAKWGSYRVAYVYSKALNNTGEFFFSAPIDNFNIWRDYGRSDDDQRHRVVFNGTIQTPLAPGKTNWQRLTHEFQLSGMLQYYSPLPFNITTGSNTVQGTPARPLLNGDFIGRNTGQGFDFLNVSVRLTRSVAITERLRLDALAEAFNLLNRVNGVALNGVFGPGVYPTSPSPTFMQTTAVAEPRTVQLALRIKF